MRKTLLAATAVLFVSAGTSVSAQTASDTWGGWHVDVGAVASTDESEGYEYSPRLNPEGVTGTIGLGYRTVLGHLVVGVEAEVQLGPIDDSRSEELCNVRDCGYVETLDESRGSDGSVSFGASLGHEVGGALVSLHAGLNVVNATSSYAFDSNGEYPTYANKYSDYAVGPYYGLGIQYPVTSRVSVLARWIRSELTEYRNEDSDGNEESTGFTRESYALSLGWRF